MFKTSHGFDWGDGEKKKKKKENKKDVDPTDTSSSEESFTSEDSSEGEQITKLENFDFIIPGHFMIIGQTGSGKTYFLRKLMEHLGSNFDRTFCLTATAKYSNDYDFVEKKNLIEAKNIYILERIINTQKELQAKGYKYNIAIILDDFLGVINLSGKYKGFFTELISQGRHYGVSLIFVSQRITGCPPIVRDNTMYMVCFRIPKDSIKDYVFNYQVDYEAYNDMYSAYKRGTSRKYSSMLIQTRDSNKRAIHFLDPV